MVEAGPTGPGMPAVPTMLPISAKPSGVIESDRIGAPLSAPAREANTVLKSAVAASDDIEFLQPLLAREQRDQVGVQHELVAVLADAVLQQRGITSSMICALLM
jgi:hypothetical protein